MHRHLGKMMSHELLDFLIFSAEVVVPAFIVPDLV